MIHIINIYNIIIIDTMIYILETLKYPYLTAHRNQTIYTIIYKYQMKLQFQKFVGMLNVLHIINIII